MFAQLQAQHGTGKSIVYALHQRINESVYPASTPADHGVVISKDFHEHGRNRCLCVWLVYSSQRLMFLKTENEVTIPTLLFLAQLALCTEKNRVESVVRDPLPSRSKDCRVSNIMKVISVYHMIDCPSANHREKKMSISKITLSSSHRLTHIYGGWHKIYEYKIFKKHA